MNIKKWILVSALLVSSYSLAQKKVNFSFKNDDLIRIIEQYSKASGQKFIIDPAVRGKTTIMLPESVTVEEAFNHLSSALAINGYAISKQGDVMVIKSARSIQRDLIEVSKENPALKPERMFTWVYTTKFLNPENINSEIRILTSKDGEMVVSTQSKQLIITDWVSNINRIANLLKEIDIKKE